MDLSRDRALMVLLNVAGLVLLVLFGGFFWWVARLVRPGANLQFFRLASPAEIFSLIAALVVVILLHEAVHGLFFWLFLRDRPTFGFRTAYAFAAAPDWFIPRNPYLVIGLSPLVLISAAGMALLPVIPTGWLLFFLAVLTLNAAGAVGDLLVVLRLFTGPAEALINDVGERFTVYLPARPPAA